MSNHNSTKRFSNRASDYAKYRPHYPDEIVTWMASEFNIQQSSVVADIGAGTGISSQLFLTHGYPVIAVEPNAEMRQVAINYLNGYTNFNAVAGTAENTLLEDKSIDIIISAQAFHWFNHEYTKKEFLRILKPNGLVALIWNERLTNSTFEKAYEEHIVRYASDYIIINHRNIDMEKIKDFFAPNPCTMKVFNNKQVLNYESFKGRHLSSSYIPQVNELGYAPMINDLRHLFDTYQKDGEVIINYDTKVYVAAIGTSI